jgi:uncharacterized protein (DUF488 family)
MNAELIVFTVGHSSHSIEDFIALLNTHGIEAIADVRSSPYSKFNPQFNREVLQNSLSRAGVTYVFLGDELGARRSEPDCYVDQRVSFNRVAQTRLFQEGLRRIVQGAAKMRIALMCAEKDPLMCHRTILVARYLRSKVDQIFHILEDATLETQVAADERLLRDYELQDNDLFIPFEERVAQAYTRRGNEIAYVEASQTQERTWNT